MKLVCWCVRMGQRDGDSNSTRRRRRLHVKMKLMIRGVLVLEAVFWQRCTHRGRHLVEQEEVVVVVEEEGRSSAREQVSK